ncbi:MULTISPECIES: hypothetical protein [Pseudomonadota]|uniref:hypothetical protein n=1 Tax=Pseudomonadota TaxID=1224 RepID=UPI0026065823|nr:MULTISPECIES: hypothetical protein [Pseudomonadota]
MHTTIPAILAAGLLAACAQSPNSIAPVPMGSAYAGIDCARAAAERNEAAQSLAALSSKQNGAVAGDAVGVFLIGVPVASLTGGDVSGQIALEKGRIASLDARLMTCGA